MIGHDPHSRPGVLDVEQALAKTSALTVDELCKVGVNLSNGSAFFFSSESGKIFEVQSTGTTRLVHTTTPAAGSAICTGASEYQGKLIWATQNRLHYITVADAITNDWSNDAVEDWQTFDVGDADFHPMLNHTPTLLLFIGDGNQYGKKCLGDRFVFLGELFPLFHPIFVYSHFPLFDRAQHCSNGLPYALCDNAEQNRKSQPSPKSSKYEF